VSTTRAAETCRIEVDAMQIHLGVTILVGSTKQPRTREREWSILRRNQVSSVAWIWAAALKPPIALDDQMCRGLEVRLFDNESAAFLELRVS